MSDELHAAFEDYIARLVVVEDNRLKAIRESPEQHDMPQINVSPLDGYLLGWLARMVQAKTVLEIGTLAGYSGTWIARSLPADGKLFTLEVSSKHAEVAQANFDHAGVAHKVEIVQGQALEVFKKMEVYAPLDLIFIDADKRSYVAYLDWATEHLRVGGLVAAHNAFRHGRVLSPESDDDKAMDAFNQKLANDERLDAMILPIGDGMAVGVRR